MFDVAAFLYLYLQTPLHAGAGSSLGIVDLPIQRERTTQYPMIQGSGIKGSLRSIARGKLPNWELIFGPETTNASDFAGALSVGDARILLFPVRSLTDVYVYTTSPDVLARFRRDATPSGVDSIVPDLDFVANDTALLTTSGRTTHGQPLVLEEFSFTTDTSDILQTIATTLAAQLFPRKSDDYWSKKLQRSLVALPTDDFRDFTLYATDVATRVDLDDETKTVNNGPWAEEHLPAETVLYVPLLASSVRKPGVTISAREVMESVRQFIATDATYLQIGGDETIGRGLVRATLQWLTPQS